MYHLRIISSTKTYNKCSTICLKISRFIHIDPESIVSHSKVIEFFAFVSPPFSSELKIRKIREVRRSRPDFSCEKKFKFSFFNYVYSTLNRVSFGVFDPNSLGSIPWYLLITGLKSLVPLNWRAIWSSGVLNGCNLLKKCFILSLWKFSLVFDKKS